MDPRLLQQIEQYLRDSGLNAQELKKRMDEVKASTTEFNRELQNAQRHFADLNSDFNDLSKQFKNVLDDLRKWDSTSNRINKSFKTLGGIADKLKYDAQEINVLNVKDLNSLEKKARVELNNLKARKAELDAKFKGMSMDGVALIAAQTKNKDLAKQASQYIELNGLIDKNGQLTNDENNYLKTLLGLIAKRQKEEKDINRTLGISGKIIDGIIGSLGKLGISSDFFENLKEDMRDAAKSGDKWKVVTTATKGLIQGIGQALKDPVTQLTILLKIANFFIKAALTANAQVVQLGKSLGSSSEEYRENLVKVESTSNNLNVTTKNLVAAFDELVTATGYIGKFSADALETQIMLTKQFGLTGDEAAGIFKFSQLTGKSSKAVNDAMVGAFVATRNSLKVGVPFKAAIAEAAKVSGALSSNFQNNPGRIAAAVVQAKALGTSLEQTAKQGESLLNFESSIENELKAELLTGKQLNLERARAAALAGDQVTLAEELVKNVGSIEEFDRMNVLQKKALAESVGLTTDELAKQLQNQKLAQESGKSLAQITKEQALEEQKRQDVQTKFNAAVEKLQSLFGNLMAGPLGSFLDALSAGLGLINKMIPALKIIGGLYVLIRGYQLTSNILSTAALATNRANYAIKATQMGTEAFITREKGVQNLMDKQGLGTRIVYNAQLLAGLISEQGIAGIKTYASTLDEKSLARKIIMGTYDAAAVVAARAKAAIAFVQTTYETISLRLKKQGLLLTIREAWKSIAAAAMSAFESAAKIPYVGWILGGVAAAGAIALGASLMTKGDDIMSEGGYGKRTLLAPEGAIRLNDKDTVIAGTDLGGGNGNGGGMPSIDLTPMISAINEVKVAVDNLMNRPVVINMDGKKVGSGLVQGSYKMA